jgi:hypothetical protein
MNTLRMLSVRHCHTTICKQPGEESSLVLHLRLHVLARHTPTAWRPSLTMNGWWWWCRINPAPTRTTHPRSSSGCRWLWGVFSPRGSLVHACETNMHITLLVAFYT